MGDVGMPTPTPIRTMARQTKFRKEAKVPREALTKPTSTRSPTRKEDATVVIPRITHCPIVLGKMMLHPINGTKLQECLCFRKSLHLKEVLMLPLSQQAKLEVD